MKNYYMMFGDLITEDLHNILVSVCEGRLESIKELIENRSINEYVRIAGINTFLVLYRESIVSRDEIVEYYKGLFNNKLEKEYSSYF